VEWNTGSVIPLFESIDKEIKMEICPCGSEKNYADCCEPLIKGDKAAQTPEELMRSRYSAYVNAEVEYIINSSHPSKRDSHDEKTIRNWSENSQWLNLEIIDSQGGGPDDDEGQVEFKAFYRKKGERQVHHELAIFKKDDDQWFFYDAQTPEQEQVVRSGLKVGRNDPCPCGSGKKFKKCCGR
jgi:SEC-C motif-containing protein